MPGWSVLPAVPFAFFLVPTLPGVAGSPVGAATITLCPDPRCPNSSRPEDEQRGYLIAPARGVFEPPGHEFHCRTLAWRRAIEAVHKGESLGLVRVPAEQAPDPIYPEVPAAVALSVIAVRRGGGFVFEGPASLERRVLRAILGYEFGGPIGDYLAAIGRHPRRVRRVSGLHEAVQNLGKLLAGRNGGVHGDRWVVGHCAERSGERHRIGLVELGVRQKLGIGFSPVREESRSLARTFADGVRRLQASGELARLPARYGPGALVPEGRP